MSAGRRIGDIGVRERKERCNNAPEGKGRHGTSIACIFLYPIFEANDFSFRNTGRGIRPAVLADSMMIPLADVVLH
jgi:hypothetical protein